MISDHNAKRKIEGKLFIDWVKSKFGYFFSCKSFRHWQIGSRKKMFNNKINNFIECFRGHKPILNIHFCISVIDNKLNFEKSVEFMNV